MRNKMQKILLVSFLGTVYSILYSQSFTDYFPLKEGNKWNYNYKSLEKEYFDISFMNRMSIDSGTIQYTIIGKSEQDSMTVWNYEEIDSIYTQVHDYYYHKDTSYFKKTFSKHQMYEYYDSIHTIKSTSYYPPFTLPFQWLYANGSKISRYGTNNTLRILSEYLSGPATGGFYDSLVFKKDIGIVFAKFITSKGPNVPYYFTWEANLISMLTNVSIPKLVVPERYRLFQNYPNPFNPSTTLSFTLPSKSFVSLKIFDLIGKEVATIVSEELSEGSYNKQWNAENLPSGIYFYRLQAGQFTETKKLLLLK